ncbi:MAG: hypothetical protein HY662_01915 [Chloroflexi bacterium]|nr:hypothetical protein [Chloroflexota bacterium]
MSVADITKIGFRIVRPSQGISEDAKWLEDREQTVGIDSTNAQSYTGLQDELLDLFLEHRNDNWDGYGAKAVTEEALASAFTFLTMLPTTITQPELSVEPDGSLVFEWYQRPGRVFSVTVEKAEQLSYSGLFDSSLTSGIESTEENSPEVIELILRHIKRVFS